MGIISAVDLFCGAGGLTHGISKSGIQVVAGFDIEENCRFPYENNNPGAVFVNKDVSKLSSCEVESFFISGKLKLLAGCAPCQPFSTYSQGRNVKADKKWPLLYSFARLIREIGPELVTMENVPDVTKHEVYKDFVDDLMAQGFHVWADKVYCPDYGLPQVRKRHVLLASKLGPIELIKPTHTPNEYKSVFDAIGHLPPIKAGEQDLKDRLHKAQSLSTKNIKRIKASKPGGSWRDWPEELIAECHKKTSGRSYGGVYARMSWDLPSPTMTTQCYGFGNGRFGHPEQHRAISLREAAILQTFPDSYQFVKSEEPIRLKVIGKMIGNAVPVDLAKVIGDSIILHAAEH